MRRIIFFFFFFLFKAISINSLGLKNQEIWTKEILEGCKFQGEESINVNANCTNQYTPDLWDKEIAKRCIDEYNKGCQLAQINKFCELGAKNNLENNETNCKIPNQIREFGIEYYKVCCDVCNKGKEAFSRKEICERILPVGSTIVDEITKKQFENCCNEHLERNLRKLEDFDDNLGEELTACSKMNCEHFCDDLDFEKGICRCRSNYRLNKDGKTCDDIDECLYENMCNKYQKCVNLPGTYECKDLILNETISSNSTVASQKRSLESNNENEPENLEFTIDCKNGYYDPHINSCVDSIDKYDKFCENEKCESSNLELVKNIETEDSCSKGYSKNEHKKCEDIDECSSPNICQKDQLCINKIGSFLCVDQGQNFECDSGLIKKDKKCVDVDECENSNICEKNQKCINMIGQYFCLNETNKVEENKLQNREIKTCEKGYKIDNENCIDINECETEICSKNETCTNLPGSYKCECKDGFEKDDKNENCIDVDECADEMTCSKSRSTCKNLIGSFECICNDGFEKSGNSCYDIDECLKNKHNCEQLCLNKIGYFECYCKEEYELQKDNRTCLLKDLCNEPNFCDGECVRENEEFICRKCPNGYELNKDKKICISSNHCKPGICPTDETCINLLDTSVCVDLNCPKNYKKNNENVCVKNDDLVDETPLSITKKIIILPLSFVESIGKKKIMKFDKINEDEINFDFDVRKSSIEMGATKNNFHLYKKNNDFYLEIIKPIESKQNFIIDVNASFKGKMLHISELKIFIV